MFQNWVIWLVVLDVVLFSSTVRRYYYEVVSFKRVGSRAERRYFSPAVRSITIIALFLVAPYLWLRLRQLDREDSERRWKEELEQRRLYEECRQRTIQEWTKRREDWLAENRITLYYRTESGVMAVLTPAAYAECELNTRNERRDRRWTKENLLVPSRDTYIFVDENGRKLFAQNHGTVDPISNGWVSGWLTNLDGLVERYRIKFELKENIFIPYVSEEELPFKRHMLNQKPNDYENGLVMKQTPIEMRPVVW